jgi:hypothetical protein
MLPAQCHLHNCFVGVLYRTFRLTFGLYLLLSTSSIHAQVQPTCPWLNSATASGFLGGPATTTVTPIGDKGDAECVFTRHDGSSILSLQIGVQTLNGPPFSLEPYIAECASPLTPIRAIGNEALACSLANSKKKGMTELVTSRVRERGFFVRLSTTVPSTDVSDLRLRASKVAELVAGFLF